MSSFNIEQPDIDFEPMPAAQAYIAWNGPELRQGHPPPGSVAIGPMRRDEKDLDWSVGYSYTGGAAFSWRRGLKGAAQQLAVMMEWRRLVYDYGINPYVAHRAFLLIREYQTVIKKKRVRTCARRAGA